MSVLQVLSIAAGLAVVAATGHSATRCVSTVPKPSCFRDIQSAVNASGPGDTITVFAGHYYERVGVDEGKDGLRISGTSALAVTLEVPGNVVDAGVGIEIDSPGVTVQRLTIRNGSQGVAVLAPGATLQGLRFVSQRVAEGRGGCGVGLRAGVTGTRIVSNEIRGAEGSAIEMGGSNDGTIVRSNTIVGAPTGIFAAGSQVQIVGNRIQLAGLGINATGDGLTVNGNVLNATGLNILVNGKDPIVDGNRISGGHGLQVTCVNCTAGSVSGNTLTGSYAVGLYVSADAPGLVVRGNRVVDSTQPFTINGTGIEATQNAVTGGQPFCFAVAGNGHALSRNTATHCGGIGFKLSGGGHDLELNRTSDAGRLAYSLNQTTGVVLRHNTAAFTEGEGFALLPGTSGTTLTGNVGIKNRADYCGPDAPIGDNNFAVQYRACDFSF